MITDPASLPDWVGSPLVQRILRGLDRPRTGVDLAAELAVTDTRVLRYLDALAELGLAHGAERWTRTTAGDGALDLERTREELTELPHGSVQDYRQAAVDLDFGMFGAGAVNLAGEHGARIQAELVAEFGDRLQSLITEYFGSASVDWSAPVKYGFRWILTPVDLPPTETS
jgi:hypothetical protein